MRIHWIALFVLCSASPLGAQGRVIEPAGVVRRPAVALMPSMQSVQPAPTAAPDGRPGSAFVPRALLGTAGAVVGVFAGAGLGVALLGRDCGGCDDPGLMSALAGAAVGAVIAGAAASAIPRLGSRCTYASRFGRGLIGSALGAVVGGVASGGSELILATYPLGIGSGASIAANTC